MNVFCIDTKKTPQKLVKQELAETLVNNDNAQVFKQYPYTIVLNYKLNENLPKYILKIDLGSSTTGLSIVECTESGDVVVWAAQIEHRRGFIVQKMESRKNERKSRRNRNTPYREARYLNRTREEDWLPPSTESVVSNIITWISRISKYCPISEIYLETNKFDQQKHLNPEISGKEYCEGELKNFKDVREKVLTEDCCFYCKRTKEELRKDGIKLELDHFIPKSKGGSDSYRNSVLACEECNKDKNNKNGNEYVRENIKQVEDLTGMSVMNQIRYILPKRITEEFTNIKLYTFDSYLTAQNREKFIGPRELKEENRDNFHWIDASCIGNIDNLTINIDSFLIIEARGHGNRQICKTDKNGFPKDHRKREKKVHGIQTGDIVKEEKGEIALVVGARKTGYMNIRKNGKSFTKTYKKLEVIQHADGYAYSYKDISLAGI